MTNTTVNSSGHRRLYATTVGLLVSGLAIASAFGSGDLDAFTDALQTVTGRYAGTILPTQPTSTIAVVAAVPSSTPTATVDRFAAPVVTRIATPIAATVVAPLPLAAPSARPAVRSFAQASAPAHAAVANVSVAAEYHLPTPAVAGHHDEPAFPSFRTTAVADEGGRTVELADAAALPVAHILPPVAAKPTKLADVPPSDVAAPVVGATPVIGATPTSLETITRGRSPVDASPITVVGAGLPDASGWVPSAGVQPDGTPGELAWETVVDPGVGHDSGGIRGATTPGWTPGTGEFHDVIVHADGSITVLPEPTSLIGLALAGVLLRRRR